MNYTELHREVTELNREQKKVFNITNNGTLKI